MITLHTGPTRDVLSWFNLNLGSKGQDKTKIVSWTKNKLVGDSSVQTFHTVVVSLIS